jgi:WD40 repeat protein
MIALETSFYVTGGTLEPDAPSYVERQADSDLFTHLSNGEFCYVLTSRQMGKSSLMARTAARLRDEGAAVVLLELTALGQNLEAEQWYDGLLGYIGLELELEEELERFWLAHERLSPLQRWLRALREVVLARHPGRVVICLDEIDAVRSLPFSTDEFFAAIRECYNRRSEDAALRRLTFCLLGVATPSNLIQDTRTTPFNIGRRVELNDFQEREAAALVQGLGREQALGAALLKRVLYWTGGHPYLTQRLCREVAQDPQVRDAAAVDRLCAELFLSHGARERDDNLLFVRERLLKSGEADLAGLLTLYGQVRSGKRVRDDETNPLVSILRLSGVTRVEDSGPRASSPLPFRAPSTARLQVRNRIYAQVFDRVWVAANMPDAEQRRQRAAFRNGLLRSAAVACAVVGVVGALALSAVNERNRMSRLLYVADMNLAQQAVSEGNPERAEELLNEHRPGTPGEANLRGFEWRYLWRLCQDDALYTFRENSGTVWGVAYSPDGKTLAALTGNGVVKLWDVITKGLVGTFVAGHEWRPHGGSVAFSPDGKMVAASSVSSAAVYGAGTLWNLATKETSVTFLKCPNGPLAFSPDGKLLAAAGWGGTATVGLGILKLWDAPSKQEVVTFQRPWPLFSVAFSPDGKTLATAEGNKPVELWNVAARRTVAFLPTSPKDWIPSVAFSPDGKTLATCSNDQTVRLWDPVTRRAVATLKTLHSREAPGGDPCFAFSPNGKKLALASDLATAVTLWDLGTRKPTEPLRGHKQGISSIAFSPDSKTLATGSADGTVKIWSAAPRGERTVLGKLNSEMLSVAFAPDSQTLATGSADGIVTLWSAASGTAFATLLGHRGPVRSVAFSHDGKVLASGGSDRTVKLWDVASHRTVATLPGHKDEVWCIAFSLDGKTLASSGVDGAVKLWDMAARREITTLSTEAGVVRSISFSLDGKRLALGTDESSVKLWDIASAREVAALPTHTRSVTATAFSPNGKILASGSSDHTVVLWDAVGRQWLATLKGSKGRINSVAFSPDGKTLASGSSETSVRLWNVATGREVGSLRGPQGPVSCVAFSPDGNALAAVGRDRVVRLWRAPSFAETDAQQTSAAPSALPR